MYLSDRDLAWALKTGRLIIDPLPDAIDSTSIDLHLGHVREAKIWDIDKYTRDEGEAGRIRPELRIGKYNLQKFSGKYLASPPEYDSSSSQLVGQRGHQVIVKPGGFLLWQTREEVGTPSDNADLICFVDGKSTRARAGILVHFTAPTIHSTWKGNITLEIANLGPFDLVLEEGDAIAQITVARITSTPERDVRATSATYGQTHVGGIRTMRPGA